MMDRERSLLDRWRAERPAYEAWGEMVGSKLSALVASKIAPARLELFFRIPITRRTKEEASLLAKAFHRGKPYENPYEDIEDKVGLRVVVLFSEDVRVVESAILAGEDLWVATKARDPQEERDQRPFEFDYQSLHYIVRARTALKGTGDVAIPEGTACEIQVRTLLQHAYSELTHDTLYKPSVTAEPAVKRAAAKSMALIEATDDYFSQVRDRLAQATAPGRMVGESLTEAYDQAIGEPAEVSPLNTLLIDFYKSFTVEGFSGELADFLAAKPFVSERVRDRRRSDLLYRQPAVLLVYYAVNKAPRRAADGAPLTEDELAPIYSDLGRRFPP